MSTWAPYEEVVIPQNMERWAIDLSKLSGFLIPDQDLANVFSMEFYEASKKEPPFAPYVPPLSCMGNRGPPFAIPRKGF